MQTRGSSLVEVMVALCLLTTITLGAAAVLPSIFTAQRRVEHRERTTAAAGEVMEQVRNESFDAISSGQGSLAVDGQAFPYTVSVDTLSPGLKEVTVTMGTPAIVMESLVCDAAGGRGQE